MNKTIINRITRFCQKLKKQQRLADVIIKQGGSKYLYKEVVNLTLGKKHSLSRNPQKLNELQRLLEKEGFTPAYLPEKTQRKQRVRFDMQKKMDLKRLVSKGMTIKEAAMVLKIAPVTAYKYTSKEWNFTK